MHTIPADQVTVTVHAHPEDTGPKGSGRDDVRDILRAMRTGNPWAWCKAAVTARVPDPRNPARLVRATARLGACSYRDAEEFKAPGGYYEDLRNEALDALNAKLAAFGYAVTP